nr:DEAD/DEAH box helicase [Kineococcus vitellinus]
MASPAERYAAARRRTEESRTELAQFAGTLGFDLDGFQLQACQALEAGRGVLVAAPTGAGKTVVGEFAAHLALRTGRKAFYTTPIKALSNQKYAELVERHGPGAVGLLTGDNSVNGEAPVVVMTTEVLRNMLYAGSSLLDGLGYVVMDEVHYLADRSRGAVWEEVIIHLPQDVLVVSLSATVSNAEEFGAWLGTVRGDTEVVVSEHRPVPLWQHLAVGTRLYDLFTDPDGDPLGGDEGSLVPGAIVNPELVAMSRQQLRTDRLSAAGAGSSAAGAAASAAAPACRRGAPPAARRSWTPWTPRACCPRSPSSSAAPAATRPCSSARRGGCASPRPRRARRSARSPRSAARRSPPPTWPSWATGSGWTGWSAAWPPTTRGCCRSSRRPWSTCSPPGSSRPSSPPRPSRWG